MAKKSFFSLALFGIILLGCSSSAASLPEFTAPVVDSVGRVSAEVETQINSELISFQQSGGPQVAVAVVDTTGNATLENYPQVASLQNVRDLQVQLEGTENRVAQARRSYNETVTDFNTAVRRFPRSIVAAMFGFEKRALFEAVSGADVAPSVDLNPGG